MTKLHILQMIRNGFSVLSKENHSKNTAMAATCHIKLRKWDPPKQYQVHLIWFHQMLKYCQYITFASFLCTQLPHRWDQVYPNNKPRQWWDGLKWATGLPRLKYVEHKHFRDSAHHASTSQSQYLFFLTSFLTLASKSRQQGLQMHVWTSWRYLVWTIAYTFAVSHYSSVKHYMLI